MTATTTTDSPPMSPSAKIGIAVAAAFGIVALFSLSLWMWWHRKQKRQRANDMVNFVDGDIVNLVDGGRFEKRTAKPPDPYDPYLGHSSQSTTPSPVYHHSTPSPVYHHSAPSSLHHHSTPSPTHTQQPPLPEQQNTYYTATPPRQDLHPSESHEIIPPPPATTVGHTRHPWSPPDYDAHSPVSFCSVQGENDFNVSSRQVDALADSDFKGAYPVEALPAILPDPRPQPQAELPAREGHHGWGHEQELPAPQQAPLRRQAPPQGNEIDEQKFLLADVMAIRQQKSRPDMAGPAG